MRILILGTGDAFTAEHFSTSALIDGPEGYVQIDCPDLIHRVLKEAGNKSGWDIDVTKINDIIVTHLHGDHSNGLESFGFYRRYALIKGVTNVVPRLYVTPPVADRLWEKLAPAMDGKGPDGMPSLLEDYFDVHILDTDGSNNVAGLSVDCRFTGHPIPTIGLKVSDGSSTLGWSGDTPFEEEHIEWLSSSDLIVHESNVGPAHTPIESLNALPEEIRSKMRLIHLIDDFDRTSTTIQILSDGEILEY